jgi:hypothetical protein
MFTESTASFSFGDKHPFPVSGASLAGLVVTVTSGFGVRM